MAIIGTNPFGENSTPDFTGPLAQKQLVGSNLSNDDASSANTTRSKNVGAASPSNSTTTAPSPASGNGTKSKTDLLSYTARRRDNPLSKLSSFAYNLSLYMVSPTTLNLYYASFLRGIPFNVNQDGVYLVAQSGGIGPQQNRAITLNGVPGPTVGFDYYIDDVTIEQAMIKKDGKNAATSDTTLTLKIVEPLGFNFVFALRQAAKKIVGSDPMFVNESNESTTANQYQQFYLLGIRFYGYNKDGDPVLAKDLAFNDAMSGVSNEFAIYERFFPITVKEFTFSLNGKAVEYSITANGAGQQLAYEIKNNVLKNNISISAGTVGEALTGVSLNGTKTGRGLEQILNEMQMTEKLNDQKEIPTVYKFEFSKNSRIPNAKLISNNSRDNSLSPTANIRNSRQSTVAVSERATTIDTTRGVFPFPAGKPITQIIDNLISNSSYLTNPLTEVTDAQIESQTTEKTSSDVARWYSIIPKIKILARDSITKDWALEITYLINEFSIPYVRSPYIKNVERWYGAHKKYNYIYTGQNSDITDITFVYNNLYFNTFALTTSKDNSSTDNNQGNVPTHVVGGQNVDQSSVKSNRNEVQGQQVKSSLNQVDNNEFSFKMLGDPDFLMSTMVTPQIAQNGNERYGIGDDVNPMFGEVFVEIVMGNATDYSITTANTPYDDGILLTTENVGFYYGQERLKKEYGITGLIMQAMIVKSTFSNGKFSQELTGALLDENYLLTKLLKKQDDQRQETSQSGVTAPNAPRSATGSAKPNVPIKTAGPNYDASEPNKKWIGKPSVSNKDDNTFAGSVARAKQENRGDPFGALAARNSNAANLTGLPALTTGIKYALPNLTPGATAAAPNLTGPSLTGTSPLINKTR